VRSNKGAPIKPSKVEIRLLILGWVVFSLSPALTKLARSATHINASKYLKVIAMIQELLV
jgi:hypothetical protein